MLKTRVGAHTHTSSSYHTTVGTAVTRHITGRPVPSSPCTLTRSWCGLSHMYPPLEQMRRMSTTPSLLFPLGVSRHHCTMTIPALGWKTVVCVFSHWSLPFIKTLIKVKGPQSAVPQPSQSIVNRVSVVMLLSPTPPSTTVPFILLWTSSPFSRACHTSLLRLLHLPAPNILLPVSVSLTVRCCQTAVALCCRRLWQLPL